MATLTPAVDYNPVPRVTVTVVAADLPATTNRLTLLKTADGRTVEVRGAISRPFLTSITLVDFEPPLGVPVQYYADAWNGTTPLGRVGIGTTTVASTDTIVQQPLNPALSVKVTRLQAGADVSHRVAEGDLVYPSGRARPTLVATGPRRARSGVQLSLLVPNVAAAAKLVASLGTEDLPQLPVWLVRTPPTHSLPRLFYCFIPDLAERDMRYGAADGPFEYSVQVNEIQPPAPGLVIPPLSYADLDAAYTSYTLMDAAYASYATRDADYSLSGVIV